VAEQVVAHLPTGGWIAKAEIAGPGFINLTLADGALARHLESVQADPLLGLPQPGAGKRLIIDYSSPNVAKPMHVAHIRSTVIGDALKRIHRALGYEVLGDNHLGDWGTQFGILIMGYRNFLDRAALAAAPVDELQRVYVLSHQKCEEDPAWKDQARAELVKLQAGDPENRALWQQFIDLSLAEFKPDLLRPPRRRLRARPRRVVLQRRPARRRREAPGAGPRARKRRRARGVPRGREAAACIVRKSDGGYNYATTDVATVFSREAEFHPDGIVYVTDERQQLHFRQFFALAKRPERRRRCGTSGSA
jgi:arginyl-tRNA synthetase